MLVKCKSKEIAEAVINSKLAVHKGKLGRVTNFDVLWSKAEERMDVELIPNVE